MNKYFSNNDGYDTAPYMVEIHGVGDHEKNWSNNDVRFDNKIDASAYADNLSSRWFGMDRWRVIEVKLSMLLKNKRKGLDCDESESAYIKGWLRDTIICLDYGELSIVEDIQELFPLEYGEWLDYNQI